MLASLESWYPVGYQLELVPRGVRDLRLVLRAARAGRGKSLMFGSNDFGPDLVFCAYDAPEVGGGGGALGRVLVMPIQLKATRHSSTPLAFKTLAYPYRQNRDSDHPTLPGGRERWALDLDAVLEQPDVVLVHAVFKTLEGSAGAVVEEARYISARTGSTTNKSVLRLTFDTHSFETLGLAFAPDLRQLERVKRAKQTRASKRAKQTRASKRRRR